MRVRSLFAAVALFVTSALAVEIVSDIPEEDAAPPKELVVTAGFPDNNPFGHVVNGENNQLILKIENFSGKNVTLLSVAGEFHHPDTDKLIKAANNNTYGVALIDGAKIQVPYTFYSEYKPGDVKLNVWIDTLSEGERERVQAFGSIVTVVEPELSIFDFKLLTTYAIVLGLVSALGYFAYVTFVPQAKKPKAKKAAVSAPVTVTATGAGGYQEEWIPEHHLRKSKGKKGLGAVSSADELSGAETSGTEGKRRKGRK
ncbi:hypothetical protein FA95DRAFT_1603474 [Auriscalpium vulgare]|uniref:Uncharacterized protein n=1 Tax=Auriscalpium vulgare TaxID=40419 RepID=A0ACB8S1Z2_9AGAM|nr:hypothetical protein FA95DRAFT_1603474 [Auriscalpium vulgare]